MKNLIFSFILLATNLFSQTNLNMDFCDFLYKKNSINHKIDFDTTNVKILIDTLKNYIIEKKKLEFPEICNHSILSDLNDYMFCFTNSFLHYGKLLYIHFPIEEDFSQDVIFSKFEEFIKSNSNLEKLLSAKVYCDIFKFNHEFTTTLINADDYTITEIKKTTNNYFIFFISYL
jgi:hypothetical protein